MKKFIILSCLAIAFSCSAQRGSYKNITEKDGKIGIGTTSPDEQLTVKGKIHTQEVLVDLEGAVAPDYVFESYYNGTSTLKSDYKMPTLTQLASFIETNHHLPGIPSAKTLSEEGMNLKEMNLLLLEKIEELTLYTLEQQKEIEALKLKVSAIKE
jgi:hypothetical protein